MWKIGRNPKIGQLWRPVAPQPYVVQKVDRSRKLPGPWTTTWSKQYLSAAHHVTCSLLWVRCLFDRLSIWDFRGKWPLKWKFSKISFRIHWRDIELRFMAKCGENRPLRSCRKVVWITTKKLGETHPSLPLCPKWADRAPERCHPICTEFCPDRRECMTLSSCTQDAGRRASRQVDSESAQNVQLTAPSNRAATAAELIVEGSSINASEYTVVYRL